MSRRWLPPLLWAAFILVLTSLPGSAVPDVGNVPSGTDKVVHATIYAVLGWLSVRAFDPTRLNCAKCAIVVAGIALFAAAGEWYQLLIPGREPDVWDWVADLIGAVLGVTMGVLTRRREFYS